MLDTKAHFLQHEYLPRLRSIPEGTMPSWGRMSLQQMIEHMADALRMANGKDLYDLQSDPVHIPSLQKFLTSDKPFKENTVAPFLPEDPLPERFTNKKDALGELQAELADFFDIFTQDKQKTVTNPVFGDLNYELWVYLLHKHAWHHLRQFGITE